MLRRNVLSRTRACRWWVSLWAVWLVIAAADWSRADIILSVPFVTTSAGATNVPLDVTLMNTGPSSVSIQSFVFKLSASPSIPTDFTITDVTIATAAAPYIFGSDGVAGPDIMGTNTGQTVVASDLDLAGPVTLGAGATVGLGRVFFNIAPTAIPQEFSFSPVPGVTNLSDASGAPITINQFGVGTIFVAASTAVPTPTAIAGGSVLLVFFGILVAIRRRRSPLAAEA